MPFLFRNTQSSSTGPQVEVEIATSFDYREIGQESKVNKATISFVCVSYNERYLQVSGIGTISTVCVKQRSSTKTK